MQLRSGYRYDIPLPEPPPGAKKRCSKCKEYKRCDQTEHGEFKTVIKYYKAGPRRYWASACNLCIAEYHRNRVRKPGKNGWTSDEKMARLRALTRLSKATPRLFKPMLEDELYRLYRRQGFDKQQAIEKTKQRAGYVQDYIKAIGDE